MTLDPRLDILGAALADASRTRILCELMDGRAFTNKELASAAGITPQTATAHLQKLQGAGLTSSLRSGRQVYHRLASAEVAAALEQLAHLTPSDHLARAGRAGQEVRLARSCYSHLAGRLGVALAQALIRDQVVQVTDGTAAPGPHYEALVTRLGLTVPPGRPLVRLCLDWTERRHHLSGPFATALMTHALEAGWLARRTGARSLRITPAGQAAFAQHFGLTAADLSL